MLVQMTHFCQKALFQRAQLPNLGRATGYPSAASNRAKMAAISVRKMFARPAVCSKSGTTSLRTDSVLGADAVSVPLTDLL